MTAIEKRAQAWTRIAKHYSEAGDVAVAEQISGFVAERFSGSRGAGSGHGPSAARGEGAEVLAEASRTGTRSNRRMLAHHGWRLVGLPLLSGCSYIKLTLS